MAETPAPPPSPGWQPPQPQGVPPMSPLGYPPPAPPPKSSGNKVALIVLACVIGVGVVFCGCVASILLPSLNRAREMANRVKCASNLRQVGMGVVMYAND